MNPGSGSTSLTQSGRAEGEAALNAAFGLDHSTSSNRLIPWHWKPR